MISVFVLAYGTQQLGLSRSLLLTAILVGSVVALCTLPLFGGLSDRFGRRTVYLCGAVFVAIYGFFIFPLIENRQPGLIVLAYVIGLAGSHASVYAVQSTWFAELFGTRVRYTGASLPVPDRRHHHLGADAADFGLDLRDVSPDLAGRRLHRGNGAAEFRLRLSACGDIRVPVREASVQIRE